ncbi:MAG: PglZ domain-containing protein [Bacteroidales bacterium]|nr:PglZ domain-containing protein [Bacteroidales bacterium]
MNKIKILWADDEIDMLKAHVIFLEEKGYELITVNNGGDALELIKEENFDVVLLDEQMPGMSGIETLEEVKNIRPNLPVIMITKSEEENIMEEAFGSRIEDYLIKPVNPKQILSSLKKILETKKLVSDKTTHSYQQQFTRIGMEINQNLDHNDWIDVYRKLVKWELELEATTDSSIQDILDSQKEEANQVFSKFYEHHYEDWLHGNQENIPTLSHTLLRDKLFPFLNDDIPTYFILIDNLRYDQWKTLQPVIEENYTTELDDIYYGIIPSATQYARNSLFSALLPNEIKKKYPDYWVDEYEEETKNKYEEQLLGEMLKRFGKSDLSYSYNKILNLNAGRKLVDKLPNLINNKLNIIVYNFIDTLSHARTDMEVIKELAEDEMAYRSITKSWFMHSPLKEILEDLSDENVRVIITTDHGSVKTKNPVKILGDRNTNTNLRYKFGKNLQYKAKEVYEVKEPEKLFLPKINVSTSYVFTRNFDFLVYPNNYNQYVNMYKDTFQHGGISMEELLIPFAVLNPK